MGQIKPSENYSMADFLQGALGPQVTVSKANSLWKKVYLEA